MEEKYDSLRCKLNIVALVIFAGELAWVIGAKSVAQNCFTLYCVVAICGMLLVGLIYVLTQIVLHRAVMKYTEHVISLVDAMIGGSDISGESAQKDTLISKCLHKLLRLNSITEKQRQQSLADRTEMKELISDVSHQLRTPLTNVRMLFNTIKRKEISASKRREFEQMLLTQIDKIESLVQSLIKASRLENGVIDIKMQDACLYDTIAQSLGTVMLSAEKKSIDIEVNCSSDIYVTHDIKWTSEALFNLLDNGVKYTPEGGTITINASCGDTYTEIEISDTGMGISPGEENNIFKRFYREDKVHDIDGIGVGLYLTREIISMQGGYITADESYDGSSGSTFKIYLQNA